MPGGKGGNWGAGILSHGPPLTDRCWCFGMDDSGSRYYVENLHSKGTFQPSASWNNYWSGRSYVGVVLRNGSDRDCPWQWSDVLDPHLTSDPPNQDKHFRSTVAWSTSVNGQRHFFMVAFGSTSWNQVKSFFSRGGELSQILQKQFRVGGLSIDTVIWLDGGSSTELAYDLSQAGKIPVTDVGEPRASNGHVWGKYIPDFIGVWSPL